MILHIPCRWVAIGFVAVWWHWAKLPSTLIKHRALTVNVPVGVDAEAIVGVSVEGTMLMRSAAVGNRDCLLLEGRETVRWLVVVILGISINRGSDVPPTSAGSLPRPH